jgi:hypothetical protein
MELLLGVLGSKANGSEESLVECAIGDKVSIAVCCRVIWQPSDSKRFLACALSRLKKSPSIEIIYIFISHSLRPLAVKDTI